MRTEAINIYTPISNNQNTANNNSIKAFVGSKNTNTASKNEKKDKILAFIGAVAGVGLVLGTMMKKQKIKNPLNVNYTVVEMLSMAGCADVGGIIFSSVGKDSDTKKRKWIEGAFQFALTSTPLLFVDTILKQCSKSKKRLINNNVTKIGASVAGVAAGSNLALWISNKLRKTQEVKRPDRKLKPIDMIANFDDAVAIMVLAKIPFADKIQIKRLLPFIYSFCGFRSGTGDMRS